MMLLRPVREDDLEAVTRLSRMTKHGLTTLPADERILGRRIRRSVEAFDRIATEPLEGDDYFLVLEDLDRGVVVGTSAIVSKVGGFQPFYAYRLETSVHESKSLGVRKEVRVLHLFTDHDGPTEIGTLFLHPDARRGGAGRLLSLGRFLLLAEHPGAFDARIIAEMRGPIDDEGRSPFWEALGQHFFDLDLSTADYLSVEDKRFIADLMPTHPVYVPLLSKEAQEVIGRVHSLTEPAYHLLQSEGFRDAGLVDIFEAGPVVECARDEIRTVRESRIDPILAIAEIPKDEPHDPDRLLAAGTPFRATKGPVSRSGQGLTIPPDVANALGVEVGDRLRHVSLRSEEGHPGAASGQATT